MKKSNSTRSLWALTAALLSLTACNSEQSESIPNDIRGSIAEVSDSAPENVSSAFGNDPVSTGGNFLESKENSVIESTDSIVSESVPESTVHEKPDVKVNDNGGEMSGTVMVLNDGRGLVLFNGSYSGGQNYAETLNEYKKRLGENVNVFSMVVPTAVSFYLPEKYSYMTASEWDHIENINAYLDGIIKVDAYTELSRHVNEEIYLRTDNHWQSLGAYYAAREFAKTALVDFAELNEDIFEFVSLENYVGTLYGYSDEDEKIKNNPETFTYYKPKTEYTTEYYSHALEYQYTGALMLNADNIPTSSWYMVNMCGDMYSVHVKTSVTNGRRLLIVKDSYGDALPAFLTGSFEDIWVVDMRHFEKSVIELCQNEGITDVLFAMNASSATGVNQENLVNII